MLFFTNRYITQLYCDVQSKRESKNRRVTADMLYPCDVYR